MAGSASKFGVMRGWKGVPALLLCFTVPFGATSRTSRVTFRLTITTRSKSSSLVLPVKETVISAVVFSSLSNLSRSRLW